MNKEDKMFDLMEKMYSEFSQRFDGLEKEVKGLKNQATLIENDQGEKLGALFDARDLTNDKLDIIDEKVDKVQVNLNSLTMKVAQSDSKIIELKQKLKEVK